MQQKLNRYAVYQEFLAGECTGKLAKKYDVKRLVIEDIIRKYILARQAKNC